MGRRWRGGISSGTVRPQMVTVNNLRQPLTMVLGRSFSDEGQRKVKRTIPARPGQTSIFLSDILHVCLTAPQLMLGESWCGPLTLLSAVV